MSILLVLAAAAADLDPQAGPKLLRPSGAAAVELESNLVGSTWKVVWETATWRVTPGPDGWRLDRSPEPSTDRMLGHREPVPTTLSFPIDPSQTPREPVTLVRDQQMVLTPAALPVRLPKKVKVGATWTHEGPWPLSFDARGQQGVLPGTLRVDATFAGWVRDGDRSLARIDRVLHATTEPIDGRPGPEATSEQLVLIDPEDGHTVWASARHITPGRRGESVVYELVVSDLSADSVLPVCPSGSLAEDGQCVRSTDRWRLPGGIERVWPEDDGTVLLATRGPEPAFVRFDPRTGILVDLPLPPGCMQVGMGARPICMQGDSESGVIEGFSRFVAGGWTRIPPFSAVGATPIALADGSLLAVGGLENDAASSHVEQLKDGAWSPLPPMPEGRLFPVAMTFEGGVRVCGGASGPEQGADLVEGCVDWDGTTWSEGPALPAGVRQIRIDDRGVSWLLRFDAAWRVTTDGFESIPDVGKSVDHKGVRLVSGQKWWVDDHWEPVPQIGTLGYFTPVGGDDWIEDHYPRVFVDGAFRWYGPGIMAKGAGVDANTVMAIGDARGFRFEADGTVAVLPALPVHTSSSVTGVFPDGTLVAVGARETYESPAVQTWVLEPGAAEWRRSADIPVEPESARPMVRAPVAVVDDELIVFARARSHRWNRTTGTWTPLDKAPFFVDRVWASGDRVFATSTPAADGQASAWWSDERGWHDEGATPEPLGESLWVPLSDGRLLVAGGMLDYTAQTKKSWFFDPQKNAWTPGPTLPGERHGGFGAELPTGEVFWLGGTNGPVWWLDPAHEVWTRGPEVDVGVAFPIGTEEGVRVFGERHVRTIRVEPIPYLERP